MGAKRFSPWIRWDDRNKLPDLKYPGVYAIAISEKALVGKRFSWVKEIVYFGMTNAVAGLRGRLKQFDNTLNGKLGHGGADRFRHNYPKRTDLVARLFVAIAIFECEVNSDTPADLLVMGDVAKAEYECLAQYAKAFKCRPKYNDKKVSPKYSKTKGVSEGKR